MDTIQDSGFQDELLELLPRYGHLVEVERGDEEGYVLFSSFDGKGYEGEAEFQVDSSEELGNLYRRLKIPADLRIRIHGNSESAEQKLARRDTWGVYKDGEWAVDVGGIAERLEGDMTYGNMLDHIIASTMTAISLAEGGMREEPDNYNFYLGLARERLQYDLIDHLEHVRNLEERSRRNRSQMHRFEERARGLEGDMEEDLARIRRGEHGDIEQVRRRVDRFENEIEDLEEEGKESGLLVQDYEKILDRNINEAKDRIRALEEEGLIHDEDYERLIELESSKERSSLEEWLEGRRETRLE